MPVPFEVDDFVRPHPLDLAGGPEIIVDGGLYAVETLMVLDGQQILTRTRPDQGRRRFGWIRGGRCEPAPATRSAFRGTHTAPCGRQARPLVGRGAGSPAQVASLEWRGFGVMTDRDMSAAERTHPPSTNEGAGPRPR